MARNGGDGVVACNGGAKAGKGFVLKAFECVTFQAFQFDADGKIVAILASAVARLARVPGAVVATDELPQRTVSSYVEVRRHLQAANALEVGVRVPVQGIGKEGLDALSFEASRRQAD